MALVGPKRAVGSFCLIALLSMGACGDKGGSGEDETSELSGAGVGTQSEDESGESGGTLESESGAGSTGAEGGNPDDGVYVEGLAIDQVEFNQGAGVLVADAGVQRDPASFGAPLIAGRPALVRVSWTADASFLSREVIARLTLVHSDGTFTELESQKLVDGAADMRSYQGAFAIEVPATDLRAGDQYVIGLFESDESLPSAISPPRVPASGEAALGTWGEPMRAKVVVVPANDPAIDSAIYDPDATTRAIIEADLFNLFPVQEVEVVYHAPVTMNGCNDGANILAQVSDLRNSEGEAGNVYYHAMFSDTHNGNCWAGGMAWLVGDGPNEDRVSYSINHPGQSPNNWTHELGHSHGRPHSFEDTAAYEPNAYPGPDCGHRSSNGYALIPAQHPKYVEWNYPAMLTMEDWIIAPTEGLPLNGFCEGHADYDAWGPAMNDVMSYAFPYWVSAYTYAELATRIRTTSAQSDIGDPSARSLHVVELADGTHVNYTMSGSSSPQPASKSFAANVEDAKGQSWPVDAQEKIDGSGQAHGYVAALPQGMGAPVALRVKGKRLALKP